MPLKLARTEAEPRPPEGLREQVNAVLETPGASQGKIAKEAGLSSAALNQWLQGKYGGDNGEVENKLVKWLAARKRRAEAAETVPAVVDYIATPTGEKIKGDLSYAQATVDLGVIAGGAGAGKTYAIKSYAASSPNVWVATMRPDTACVASCLEEIGEAVGVKMTSRAARQSRDLTRRMQGTGGLLVIDEAQHLNILAIEAVRSIYDAAGIGLVLCGNESVYARLTGGSRAAAFAQLFSRIGKRLILAQPSREDVAAIAAAYGVNGTEERKALFAISQKPGALRAVVKTLKFSAVMAAGNNDVVNHHYIISAWRGLGGE
jgi:DNA transposition AAA+ family ATPase